MAGLVVKAHQLVGAKGKRRVRLTGVIAELNLVYTWRKIIDNRPDLSPQQTFLRDVFEQRNYR